jgi:mRNA-degrading endonuclease YafQ of YafQ-DinJ toxin-antitoxin module
MRFEFKPSFDRSIKSLSNPEKEEIKKIAIELIDTLSCNKTLHKGMGLKRLKGDFWEIRKDIKARILFRWKNDLIEFILAGDHDDVKRCLKNIS